MLSLKLLLANSKTEYVLPTCLAPLINKGFRLAADSHLASSSLMIRFIVLSGFCKNTKQTLKNQGKN